MVERPLFFGSGIFISKMQCDSGSAAFLEHCKFGLDFVKEKKADKKKRKRGKRGGRFANDTADRMNMGVKFGQWNSHTAIP